MNAARELAVAERSAKVKRELDNARMEKKERRPLKEFTDFRTEISEHVGVPAHSMPPNILILRRKTIRQFPNNVMVALYFNDKLGQYFSIPYGTTAPDDAVITPVALKEEIIDESNTIIKPEELFHQPKSSKHHVGDMISYTMASGNQHKRGKIVQVGVNHVVVHRKEPGGGKYGYHYKVPHDAIVKEEVIQEDAISHLQKVKAFATDKPLYHKDGSQTRIDPTTAHALLSVHDSLHPDNRKKFADHLEHSQTKFHKMLDFAWKQVK